MLQDAGVADMPVGVDIVEPPFLFEMQRQGLTVFRVQAFREKPHAELAERMLAEAPEEGEE